MNSTTPFRHCAFRTCFVLATLALLILPIIQAQRIGFDIPKVAQNRLFKVSFDWPISRFLNNETTILSRTKVILEHIREVEEGAIAHLRNRTRRQPDDPLRICNFDRKSWLNSVRTHFGNRGWADPNLDCITELHGVAVSRTEPPLHSLDTIFDSMAIRGRALDGLAKKVSDLVLGNWTDPHVVYNTPYNKLSARCALHHVGGVRVNGNWHIITSFTNAPKEQQLANFQRQYLIEYQRIGDDGKFVKPLIMRIPERENWVIFDNVTTSLSSWRGLAGSSFFGATFVEDNPAVNDALDAIDFYVQQAEDAMTPSGIAILVLPLLLNLIPISLLAEVSTAFMLVYVLLSDVLTAIPLAIKGGELIFIGRRRERAVVMRFSSSLDGKVSETAASELWAAECRSNNNVLVAGIVFVVVSVTLVMIGIAAELISKDYVKRRKARRKQYIQEQQQLIQLQTADSVGSISFVSTAKSSPSGDHTTLSLKERRD